MSLQNPLDAKSYHEAWYEHEFKRRASSLVPAAVRAVIADEAFDPDGCEGYTTIGKVNVLIIKDKRLDSPLPTGYHCAVSVEGVTVFDTRETVYITGNWETILLNYAAPCTDLPQEQESLPDYRQKLAGAGVVDQSITQFAIGSYVWELDGTSWIVIGNDQGKVSLVDLHGKKKTYRFAFQLQPVDAPGKTTRLVLVIEALATITPEKAMFVAQNAPAWLVGKVALALLEQAVAFQNDYFAFHKVMRALKVLAFKYDGNPESEFAWTVIKMIGDTHEAAIYSVLVEDLELDALEVDYAYQA